MRPIWAQKVHPHVGHKWVGVVVAVCTALALRTARFRCALVMCLISVACSRLRDSGKGNQCEADMEKNRERTGEGTGRRSL